MSLILTVRGVAEREELKAERTAEAAIAAEKGS